MTTKEMSYEQIKHEFKARNIAFSDVAIALKKSLSHVTNVAKGTTTSEQVALAICLCLDKKIEHVFGDIYSSKGKPGPKNREARRQAVIAAIKANKPVPSPSVEHF